MAYFPSWRISPHGVFPGSIERTMTRIFLIVVAAGLLLIAVGAMVLAVFPPNPRTQPVEKVLPNDRFQGR
jgi:hypothetical protein